jgi:invasion protein IalB
MKTQTLLILVALVLLVAGGVILWTMGGRETPAATASRFDDWLVRCQAAKQGELACALSQHVLDRRTGRSLVQLTVSAAPGGENLLGIVVPLGVSVPDGVTLQTGDATRRLAYTQCLPGGCIATLKLDATVIEKMKSTPEARLAVIDRRGQPVVMPVSLKGFAPAFAALNSSGNSWLPAFLTRSAN